MSIAIERLNEDARASLAAHFLALPARDRYLRFAAAVTPQIIARYVAGIDFKRDTVFAVRPAPVGGEGEEAPAGVVHAAFPEDGVAELGISVLPTYRGQGLASALAERAIAHARSRGMRALAMQLLRENAPMLRIAHKLGMTIVDRGAELFARLELLGRKRGLGSALRHKFATAVLRPPSYPVPQGK
jgi:RimJ/RimL family protein N-acetyltransferase